MTRTCGEGLGPVTTSRQLVSSLSFVPCPCDWTRDGTRSSSTCPTSRVAHTAPIMWRHSVYRFMQIAASDASTSPIVSTRRTSCRRSLSSSFPFRSRCRSPMRFVAKFCMHHQSIRAPNQTESTIKTAQIAQDCHPALIQHFMGITNKNCIMYIKFY